MGLIQSMKAVKRSARKLEILLEYKGRGLLTDNELERMVQEEEDAEDAKELVQSPKDV